MKIEEYQETWRLNIANLTDAFGHSDWRQLSFGDEIKSGDLFLRRGEVCEVRIANGEIYREGNYLHFRSNKEVNHGEE